MNHEDKRQTRRARVLLGARLHSRGGAADAWIRDLSSSGALVACKQPLAQGTPVVLARGDTVVAGHVAWEAKGRMGITFAWTIEEASILVQTPAAPAKPDEQPYRRPGFREASRLSDEDRVLIETWGGA